MGANAVISWENVSSKPSIPNSASDVGALSDSYAGHLTTLTSTGVYTGTLQAVDGTFTGTLQAVNGTFTGDLDGVNGTFSGDIRGSTFISEFTKQLAGGTTAIEKTIINEDGVQSLFRDQYMTPDNRLSTKLQRGGVTIGFYNDYGTSTEQYVEELSLGARSITSNGAFDIRASDIYLETNTRVSGYLDVIGNVYGDNINASGDLDVDNINASGDLDVIGTIYGDSVSLSGYISGGNIYGDNINISYDIDAGGDITATGDINADNVYTDYTDGNRLKLESGTTQIFLDPGSGNIYFLSNGTVKHAFYSGGTKSGGSIEIDGVNLGMSPVDSPQIRISTLIMDVELLQAWKRKSRLRVSLRKLLRSTRFYRANLLRLKKNQVNFTQKAK